MSFEEAFFGPGNRIRWDAIRFGTLKPDVKARLGPFLEDLQRAPDVLVLPRVREDDGRVQWYVLCASERVARVARDELRAFLGPSYSDFEGQPTPLDSSDSIEHAVLERCGSNAFRLEIPQRDLFNTARERLLLLTRLRAERPVRTARRPRAVGRVLRDFEYGLIAADGESTALCIQELKGAGQIGATNLLFLEVRRFAALGDWHAILALPELTALISMPRPRRVTEALIRAVYALRLREFENEARAADALERFRTEIFPQYRDLFRSHAGLSGYDVDAGFLLAAAASEPPRRELADSILQRYPDERAERRYLAALAALSVSRSPEVEAPRQLAQAQEAFSQADVDRAYEIVSHLPPSFEACALLLRCARDMGTLAAAQAAIASVDRLPEGQRNRVLGHAVLGRILDALHAFVVPPPASVPAAPAPPVEIPSSWAAWLRRLGGDEPWRSAVTVAEIGAREWDREALSSNGEAIAETAELILAERPPWGQAALRDALPHLIEFFLARVDARLKPIYEHLFLAIAVDEQVSLPQISGLLRVAEARLQLGVSAQEYREIVQQLITALDAAESPAITDVALETIDVLASEVCPDVRQREECVARVAAIFHRWYRRIDTAQWALLRRLAEEVGIPDAVGAPPADDGGAETASIWNALQRKRVALYSLREAALRRVRSILMELCPGVQVETFSDHVGGSPALRAASATSDIFVLATAAAKHAATIYIEANRPSSSVTLYARGQGSASLLDAIRDFLRRTVAEL